MLLGVLGCIDFTMSLSKINTFNKNKPIPK